MVLPAGFHRHGVDRAELTTYLLCLALTVVALAGLLSLSRGGIAAMAVAVSSLWIACFVLTFTFPWLNKALGSAGTFWLYAGICVVGFIYIFIKLPETKNKSLEQIERDLVD